MDRTQMAAAVDAMVLVPPSEADHERAVAFVRRHAGEGAPDVLAALGLDRAEPPAKCGSCGYRRTSKNHMVICHD